MNEETMNLLQELKLPSAFSLYNTRDNSLLIPRNGYGVLLLVDRASNGLNTLGRFNIGNQMKYIYLPKQIKVYNKRFNINRATIAEDLQKSKLNIIHSPGAIKQSFIVDVTPYIAFLFNRFNIYKYIAESISFIDYTLKGLSTAITSNVINKWILLYVIDDNYMTDSKIIDKSLYGYSILRTFLNNNKTVGALGSILDEVFLCHVSNGAQNEVRKVYDKQSPVDYSRLRTLILKIKPNLITSDQSLPSTIIEKEIEDSKQSTEKETTDNNTISKETEQQTSTIDNRNDITTEERPQDKHQDKSIFDILGPIERNSIKNLINLSTINTNQTLQKGINVITKINNDEYDTHREIPVLDTDMTGDDTQEEAPVINIDNNKMYPFLNAIKSKNDNITDTDDTNAKDMDNDITQVLQSLVPEITKDVKLERRVYNYLYSKVIRNPKLVQPIIDLYKKKSIGDIIKIIEESDTPYDSYIYPQKGKVDKNVLKELDDWSTENGYISPVSSDPILNSDIISSTVNTNIHRVMAQKQLTWNNMPQQVEKYVTKLLEDNEFQLISVTMLNKEPPITQIEPTYKSEIRLKIRNKRNKKSQTIVFDVPTLLEGKYHISGGIKWLFPNVIATLPIFVIKPGKVQFRSSYAAVTYQHHHTSQRDNVSVFVGGVNLSLLVWLLQYYSFNQISKDLGFTYKRGYLNKKSVYEDNHDISILDLDKKTYIGITITNKDNTKLIKGIAYDLQVLLNKLSHYEYKFDDFMYDQTAQYIQFFAAKKNISYLFEKIKRYTIDKRTEEILIARGIKPDMYEVAIKCANLCINDIDEERLGITNVNIRLMDLIPSQIEKGLHYAIAEYKRRALIDPDAGLMVNSAWVINKLREESVLLLYKDGNPSIEAAQFTAARIVGPGGFGKVDMVQIKDRNLVGNHFGTIDCVDTAEGNPGISLSLTTGFEYDPTNYAFSDVISNNSYKNMFGTVTSQIPFISSDDGNRAQYGGAQGRQVVPIIASESPLVGTGTEAYLPNYNSDKFSKRSPVDGIVTYIDHRVIIIKDRYNKSYMIDVTPSSLQTGAGKYNGLTHTPTVSIGDTVKKNQHLVTNQFIKPVYSAGSNVLACFKPENGYTYDDGIVVSESFAKRYTSLHYQNIDFYVNHVSEISEYPLMKFKKDGHMKYKANETIIKIKQLSFGGFTENEVIAPTACEVIDIQVFPSNNSFDHMIRDIEDSLFSKTNSALKNSGLKPLMDSKKLIENTGKYEFRKDKLDRTLVRIRLIEYRSIGAGDKLSNRHGNKGVIAAILPDDKMPRLPDGRNVDICLNPLGVISRMNIGQLIEIHVGNILDSARKWLIDNKGAHSKCIDFICKLYTLLDGFSDKRLSIKMSSYLRNLPENKQTDVLNHYREHGIRMIFPPFQTPKIESIYEAAKLVNTELESYLYLPQYDRKTINPVTWGILFITKLEHISAIKQNVRSIGPYIQTTMMPAKPGYHRNAIRVGEQDSWAYLAYNGGKEVLKEIFLVNGDNPSIKADIIRQIEETGNANFNESDYNESGATNAFKVFSTVAGLAIK